jgi:hypothetical protein
VQVSHLFPDGLEQTRLTHSINRLGIKRLIVFLYTHSNPDNGDLLCTDGAALEPHEVFTVLPPSPSTVPNQLQFLEAIITPELANFASQSHSILFMEACGGVWNFPSSARAVRQYAQS